MKKVDYNKTTDRKRMKQLKVQNKLAGLGPAFLF